MNDPKSNFKTVHPRKQAFYYFKRGILSIMANPWKCILPVIWILICIYLWTEKEVLFSAEEYGVFTPLVEPLISVVLKFYFVAFFLIIIGLLGYPWGRKKLEEDFHRIGLVNEIDEAPFLLGTKGDPKDKRVKIYFLHPA